MNSKIKLKETTIEAPIKDIKTLKSTNSIAKDDIVKVVPDNQNKTVTGGMPMTEEADAIIEPQDPETIKYLSNVKDDNGEISKPFNIDGKNYQMIRGVLPSNDVVLAVYCLDDVNEAGENIIHPMDYFEENIAKPFKENTQPKNDTNEQQGVSVDKINNDNDNFIDYLNLADLAGYKHFFVNVKTGETVGKFKSPKEMAKSGIKLGPDDDYMDATNLKRFRFGSYFKNNMNEDDTSSTSTDSTGVNVPKLQADVVKLVDKIKKTFSIYLSKLDKPIEQAQFLTTMAQEIGVPLNKLSSMIDQFKDITSTAPKVQPIAASIPSPQQKPFSNERKIITKKDLMESITKKNIIKKIKVKDIK